MADDEAIEQVVRGFLASLAEPLGTGGPATFLTGKLREYVAVVEHEARSAVVDEQATVTIGRVVVTPGNGPERIADVEALLSWTAQAAGRPAVMDSTRISGPLRVLETAEGWKVADYVRDGRPRTGSIVLGPSDWLGADDDVRVRILAVELAGTSTSVDLEVENHSDSDRYVGTPWFARRLVGRFWRFFAAEEGGYRLEVASHEAIRTYIGIRRRFPMPPVELRLFVPFVRFGTSVGTGLDLRLYLTDRIEDVGSSSSYGNLRAPGGLRIQTWVVRLAVAALVGFIAWSLLLR